MKRIFIFTLLLMLCTAGAEAEKKAEIKRISATYEYVSDNASETAASARRTALERARQKALEDNFGLDVSSVNATLQRSRTVNGEAEASTRHFALGSNSVHGEWIETLEEKVLEGPSFDNGFWRVKVHVEGRARNKAAAKTGISYAFLRHTTDKNPADRWDNGDDLFLRFSSPVSGSLCVYLVDEQDTAYCLLPYSNATTGCQTVEAGKDYMFFSAAEDNRAVEYTLNCRNEAEQNALYVVFTPHTLVKANDRESAANWQGEPMPRQLTYKDFLKWLEKNIMLDEDMVVRVSVVDIRKAD